MAHRKGLELTVVCGHCKASFVTTDARKLYCDDACSTRGRAAAWRERNPERSLQVCRESKKRLYVPKPARPKAPPLQYNTCTRCITPKTKNKSNWCNDCIKLYRKTPLRPHTAEQYRKYRERNPAKYAAFVHNYRGRFTRAGSLDGVDFLAKAAKGCFDCGRTDVPMTIGHLVPLSRGGSNSRDNIEAQCRPCNSTQGAKVHVAVYDVWYPFA